MLKKSFVSSILVLMTLISNAGNTDTRNVKVGDEVHVYTTYHSNTQSVLWDWDSSVMELQGQLYGSSTSATFKVIASTPSSGSVIQATTYYYEDGTTSSGINKDVDVWKIYSTGNGGGGSDDDLVNPYTYPVFDKNEVTIEVGNYVDIKVSLQGGSYVGKYNWSSSDGSVATISPGKEYGRVFGVKEGHSTIKLAFDNGNFAKCEVYVVNEDLSKFKFQKIENVDEYEVSSSSKDYEGQLVIPDYYNGFPVTKISNYGFSKMQGLISVKLGSNVKTIGKDAFYNCHELKNVSIPHSVTSIESEAFRQCWSLTSIEIPNSVTTIGEHAFYICSDLVSLTIPNSVTFIGEGVFAGCRNLTDLIVATDNPVYSSEDGILYERGNELGIPYKKLVSCPNTKTKYTIPNSVSSIGNKAFDDCTKLSSIKIPNSVTSIGEYAFGGCEGLVSIEIPNTVTLISNGTFSSCKNLSSLIIPNSVTSIGNNAFNGCKNLVTIDFIPNSVTSIGNQAFDSCSGLFSVDIPNSVTSIGSSAFRWCSNLVSL